MSQPPPTDVTPIRPDDPRWKRVRERLRLGPPTAVCAWLFGSHSQGRARADSDIDIGILIGREPDVDLNDFGFELADALSEVLEAPVDLVVLERTTPDFVHRVLRDGILLFDDNPSYRVRFEVHMRAIWLDMKPYRDEYRRTGRFAQS